MHVADHAARTGFGVLVGALGMAGLRTDELARPLAMAGLASAAAGRPVASLLCLGARRLVDTSRAVLGAGRLRRRQGSAALA